MTFQHWAGVSSYTSSFDLAETCVFVKQLLGPFLCDLLLHRYPFSRSYGVNLPSSLTMLLPLVLGSSPHLPVSVCGTGAPAICLAHFPGSLLTGAVGCPRRDFHTFRFGSVSGFAWIPHNLHPSTEYSVTPRPFHSSVYASLTGAVTEC